jgi:ABC-2 type transport system permease protein
MNPRNVLAIARKDISDAIKNRYLLMSLVLPIGLSVLFQLIFGQIANVGTFRVAVYDPGGSRLTDRLRAVPDLNLVEVESKEALLKEVNGDAVGGLSIPDGFDRQVDLGEHPELTVFFNSRKGGGELAVFREIVAEQVWAMGGAESPAKIVWSQTETQARSEQQSGFRKAGFRMDFYLLVMFLIMSLTMTGSFVVPLLLVEEKEKHTMEFLLVSPATPAEIAAGKALTGLTYSVLSAGILIALNHGWSGNWPATFLAVAVGALFLVMAGLLMGSLLHTTMQINTWSTMVMMILLAPSWLSVLQPPPLLDAAVRIIPTFYLTEILSQSLAGEATPAGAAGHLGLLLACTAAVFGIIVWVMRRQET